MPEEKPNAGKGARNVAVSAETVSADTARDHAAISRLADDLLPALIAKLTASNLGEIEVRQGGWKARLRKTAASEESKRAARAAEGLAAAPRGTSVAQGGRTADEARRAKAQEPAEEPNHASAVSPAVGIFHPLKDLAVGMRVRSGDRIGVVDVLGVKQDVTSPVEGVIGSSLVEAGEAVEFGQELVRIELPERNGAPAAAVAAGIAGKA